MTRKQQAPFSRASIAVATLALLGGTGCGGGGSRGTSSIGGGQATLTVKWPARTRLIPAAANSLVAVLSRGGTEVARQVVTRPGGDAPTTTATFSGLPYGSLTVDVNAYPDADGSGNAQAAGAGVMAVSEDKPGAVTVALSSTISELNIAGVPATIGIGQAVTPTLSATDKNGDIVLLSAGGGSETVTWTIDDPNVGTISGTGPSAEMRATHPGTTMVRASVKINDGGTRVTASTPFHSRIEPVSLTPTSAGTIYYSYVGAEEGWRFGGVSNGATLETAAGFLGGKQWVAEFDLTKIPSGARITSAILSLRKKSGTSDATSVDGYPSNGRVDAGDFKTPNISSVPSLLKFTPGDTGDSLDVTAFIQKRVDEQARFPAFRFYFPIVGRGVPFYGTDTDQGPRLTISYDLP